ncbi:hypothetical protein DSO57_1017696 [Entomophthora muscae]|uniref:Uncharacterized protein n=1 Tax=Entomophthora muscae TaxID=34485 RepID=A0ACC2T4R7_9FUNG|nr:hypothetical protein DSO57_1017696 [Entomophthora muscae]
MLVALAFVCNQMNNNKYRLVAHLVPLSVLKRSCYNPSHHSIPYLPADSASSEDTP